MLTDLYAWYRRGERALGEVFHDAEMLPALQETLSPQREAVTQIVELLPEGRLARGKAPRQLAAGLALLVDFRTWTRSRAGG